MTNYKPNSNWENSSQQVDHLFTLWDKTDSPGMSIGVIQNGELIYGRGYGQANLEHATPITTKTVFYIASESKQFTAACVVLLSRQGKLSLDEEIQKHLPEIDLFEAPITIRHLIHHTSGIREYFALGRLVGFDFANNVPDEQVLKLIASQQGLNYQPGEKFEYSNSGYFLLGQIVKRTSGLSLRKFAEQNIFAPLGMKNTCFRDDHRQIIPNRATGYYGNDEGFRTLVSNHTSMGDGGVWTTVEDLCLWDANFYSNVVGGFGQDFIEELTTPGALNNGASLQYAFGLDVASYRGAKTIDHGGRFAGYSCDVLRFPAHKFSVICLANVALNGIKTIARNIADIYLNDVLDATSSDMDATANLPLSTRERKNLTLNEVALNMFAGTYHSSDLDISYQLEAVNGKLCVNLPRTKCQQLTRQSANVFEGSGDFGVFEFATDGHHLITGYSLSVPGIRGIFFARVS